MRVWWAIATLVVLSACTRNGPGLSRPAFGDPRGGVWNPEFAVVQSRDDDMMPDLSASGWLIYASRVNGNVDLYRRPFNGGSPERLTDHSGEDADPVFSPDGKQIAFTSQAADVKGDIWIMDVDGSGKRRLTDRSSFDSAPCWSPSGRAIYFNSNPPGERERIERFDLEYETRTVIVKDAWDPSLGPNGQVLFYATLDDDQKTRIFALRLSDGATVSVTDGAYPEGFPRVRRGLDDDTIELLLVRFADDRNRDGVLDGSDSASLWTTQFDLSAFDAHTKVAPIPLTGGAGSELFVSAATDWIVYTTSGYGDLELYALPVEGRIARGASNAAILAAAQSEDDENLRRLGLRHLIVTAPELEGPAHYLLARDLAERGLYQEASTELARAARAFGEDPRATVSRVEITRLELLRQLDGRWWARNEAQRKRATDTLGSLAALLRTSSGQPEVEARIRTTMAETRIAVGQLAQGTEDLERLVDLETSPNEDRARALDRLAETYVRLGDRATLARLCERLLREFADERYYARRCADRWVASASAPVGVPAVPARGSTNALGISVLAELERLATRYRDIPMLEARARAALANEQAVAGHDDASRAEWRRIVEEFPKEREVLSNALVNLARSAERRRDFDLALEGYEQLLRRFAEDPALRARARQGISRIALQRAQREEADGNLRAALEDYKRILSNDRELTVAHRRYISLSAQLGELNQVIEEYRRASRETPRDKLARYGLGFALTFGSDPDIYAAQSEIIAALELDPRLAPAHLTLGWIRLQRERLEPREGWAEKAADSFKVAEELADRETEASLYAAARLNSGNALFALNKLDDAFLAYLDRELSRVAFESPTTELIFRERFARTALREDHLDVALDQANLAYSLSQSLEGTPRSASIAALIGGIYFLATSYDRAIGWLDEAQTYFRKRQDWDRAIPLLRSLSLAEQQQGRFEEAQAHLDEVLALIADGKGPADPSRPFFENFEFLIWSETGAKPSDVTLGPYGFVSELELQFADALAGRNLSDQSQPEPAFDFMQDRLTLLRAYYEKSGSGTRATPEWIVALNESGVYATRAGRPAQAEQHFSEALAVAVGAQQWASAVQISESLLNLWLRFPETHNDETSSRVEEAMEQVLAVVDPDLAQTAGRVGALVALYRFQATLEKLSVETAPRSVEAAFLERLKALDTVAANANRAQSLATDFGLDALARHLPKSVRGPQTFSAETEEDGVSAEASPNVPEEDLASEGLEGPGDLSREEEELGERALIRTRFLRTRRLWREDYSESLVAFDPNVRATLLRSAVDGYLSDPIPCDAPEVSRFVSDAEQLLRQSGDATLAWTVLEHTRLLELQPSAARIKRGDYPSDWLALIDARNTDQYVTEGSRALVRALEGIPTTLDSLRGVLGPDSVLLQYFDLPGRKIWYAIDSQRLEAFPTSRARALPEALSAWLQDSKDTLATVYVDGGSSLDIAPGRLALGDSVLGERFEVAEALSATYLLASYEARNLARGPAAAFDGLGAGDAALVVFDTPIETFGTALRTGSGQVLLSPRDEEPVNLESLSSTRLNTQAALFTIGENTEAVRLLAQAALIAGSPATLSVTSKGEGDVESVVGVLADALDESRIASVVASLKRQDLRLFGHRGMALPERIEFAYAGLLQSARQALPAYRNAQKSGALEQWKRANETFSSLIGYIEYLMIPAHRQALRASSIKGGAALADSLPARLVLFKQQWANTFASMGSIDEAVTLRREIARSYENEKQNAKALAQYLELGRALLEGKNYEEAREALERCATLAREQTQVEIEADCRSRLGSVYRGLYDYEAARESYEASIALYTRINHRNQYAPARYLGFLYETVLNDYESALAQFEVALNASRRFEEHKGKAPGLLIDIARIYRLRGEYEQAIASVQRAQELVPREDLRQLTEINLETANIYWYRGSYRRARRARDRALELSVATGDTFRRIQALSVGGLIAMNQGDLDEAEALIRAALELSRITRRRSEEAAQLNNLGVVLQRSNRIDEAIDSFSSALIIDEALESREGRAFDLRNLGSAYGRVGRYDDALAALNEALALSRKLGIKYNEVESLYRRGEILNAMGRESEASAMFGEAATLATQITVPEVQWRSLYALGRLEETQGKSASARAFYRRSLTIAERLSRSRDESTPGATRDDLYEDAARLAIEEGDLEEVFELFERRRARARLDAFSNRTVPLADPESQRLLREELRSRDQIYAAEREVSLDRVGAKERLMQAQNDRDERYRALKEHAPRIARSFTLDPTTLSALQQSLPPRVALVTYLIGGRTSYALLVRRETATTIPLETNRTTLEPVMRKLREQMSAFAPVNATLRSLGALLLAPLTSHLDGVEHLVLVPDSTMSTAPFPAMRLGDTMLADRYITSQVSSASMLVDLLEVPPARVRTVTAFAYGRDLPFASLEARAVSASPVLSANATIRRLRQDRSDAWDLAVHANLDSRNPLGSTLELAPSEENNGRLEASAVFSFPRVPALVTLSGCETGVRSIDGSARSSLADSFIAAGAQTVVATQTRVSDLAAALVMKWFYRFQQDLGTGEALNEAMKRVRAEHPHPAHWASFTLMGDFR